MKFGEDAVMLEISQVFANIVRHDPSSSASFKIVWCA
jgi:hypothetical protein